MNKTVYTPFRTKYTNRPENRGERDFSASITQPDLSYSVNELVNQFAIGSLPSLAELQPWIGDSYDEDDTSGDFGFGKDKAGMLEDWLNANSLRRDIFEKLRARYAEGKAKNPELQVSIRLLLFQSMI